MVSTIATLLLGLVRWIVEMKAQKKLNDKQFIAFIEAHQAKRLNTGKTASSFEDALQETLDKIEAETK